MRARVTGATEHDTILHREGSPHFVRNDMMAFRPFAISVVRHPCFTESKDVRATTRTAELLSCQGQMLYGRWKSPLRTHHSKFLQASWAIL